MTTKRTFNLIERTRLFAEDVLKFIRTVPNTIVTRPLISQLVRSSTSIGANYHEADNAELPRDFRHKVGICRKEASETEYWLRMVSVAHPSAKTTAEILSHEANELMRIFSTSIKTVSLRISH